MQVAAGLDRAASKMGLTGPPKRQNSLGAGSLGGAIGLLAMNKIRSNNRAKQVAFDLPLPHVPTADSSEINGYIPHVARVLCIACDDFYLISHVPRHFSG